MNKKFISFITAATLLSCGSFNAVLAADNSEKVEISFKVGDSTLLINGAPTTVETPYVAGEGTTLVPIRVITEAFGAKVDWDNDTETVTLEYPDVNVKLQIGNKTATINDHTETLLEAPVLSSNDVTMVPLRFISETFGATVTYDNTTEAILVTKENIKTDGTVTGITDLSKIGDSFYGWSMNTPTSLTMTDRTFGGLSTIFENETSSIEIEIAYPDDDLTIDTYLESLKKIYSGMTLVKADKNLTDSFGNKYINLQAKDNKYFIDRRAFFVNNKIMNIYAKIDVNADNSEREKFLSYIDSFSAMGYNSTDTHNLANLNNDKSRTFKDDKYKITMNLPQEFVEYSSDDLPENTFSFSKFSKDETERKCQINMSIYSKSDMDAKTMAETDFVNNTEYYNTELIKVTEPEEYTFNGQKAYKYTLFVNEDDIGLTDIFFEKGDYTYNISFHLPKDDTSTIPRVLNSLKAETLDSAEISTLIRNTPDATVTSTKKTSTFSLKVPTTWYTATSSSSSGILLINSKCGASMLIADMGTEAIPEHEMSRNIKAWVETMGREKNAGLAVPIENKYISGTNWHIGTVKYKNSKKETVYETTYLGEVSNKTIIISLLESEATFRIKTNTDIEAMLKTITID